MGGCKCSFHNCVNNTNLAKESNSVHSHFFHYPVRDPKRCVEWAVFSNRMEFLKLPFDKLKNKVICDYHFSENHFMNYTRSKLNKTTAIPTIYINENKEEIDLLESPTEWVAVNRAMEIPEQFKNLPITKIDIDDSSMNEPLFKKIKTETLAQTSTAVAPSGQPKIKILNKAAISIPPQTSSHLNNRIITYRQIKSDPHSMNRTIQQHTKLPTSRVHKTASASSPLSTSQVRVEKVKVSDSLSVSTQSADFGERMEDSDTYEYVTVVQNEDHQQVSSPSPQKITPFSSSCSHSHSASSLSPVIPVEIKDFIARTSEGIDELKTIMVTQKSTPTKEEPCNINQSNLNKVQLFNGIKRYLPPSLMALLRMELFGGPNREFKKDEKVICGELLKLGEETYDFFNDEWRLRLPSKAEVTKWLSEDTEDDDDAC